MKNIFCLLSILKSKAIEYKKVIVLCAVALLFGIILGVVFATISIDEYTKLLLKDNLDVCLIRFLGVLFVVGVGIFISTLNYYLNILTPISIVLLGYYFGKYLALTFRFNLFNSLLSIAFFFIPLLLICLIYVVCLSAFYLEDYFSKAVDLCNSKYKLIKMLVSYLVTSTVSILIFLISANFTNTINII